MNIKTLRSLFLVVASLIIFIGCSKNKGSVQNKTSTIHGTIVDIYNGEPLSDVGIGVFIADNIISSVIGGADGHYEVILDDEFFDHVNSIHIVVMAGHTGYYTDSRELDVKLGTDYHIDFFLEPE